MTFNCDQCDASYPVRMSLLNHFRFMHGNPEEFTCQHCVYRTTKKENLHQHVRSIHEKIKAICDLCGKKISDKSNLNKHMKKVQDKKEAKRKASDTAPRPAKRMKHDASKELTCGVCHAKFKELFNLNKHNKLGHEEKGLKCNTCSHTSNNQFNMQRHIES